MSVYPMSAEQSRELEPEPEQPAAPAPMPAKKEVTQLLYLLGDRILIRPEDAPEQIGGVVLPEAHRDEHKLLEGDVLLVGPGRRAANGDLLPLTVEVGHRVVYGQFNGQPITVNGEALLVLREDEVLAGWMPANKPAAE